MSELELWLRTATRHLSNDSSARVRQEIEEHYSLTREALSNDGATAENADRFAMTALGDATTANCQYRKVLLTSAEAWALHDSKREGRAFCSRFWLKWALLAIPVAMLSAATIFFLAGSALIAQTLLLGGIVMSTLIGGPLLPIYTPARGRVFRSIKWVVMVVALGMVWGPDWFKWSWLTICSLWPMAQTEWTRVSIRRKLPVKDWPKALYL